MNNEELIHLQAKLSAEKLADILKKYIDYYDARFNELPLELIKWSSHDFESDAVNLLKKWGSPDFESDEQKEAA